MKLKEGNLSPIERLAQHGTDEQIITYALRRLVSLGITLGRTSPQWEELGDRAQEVLNRHNEKVS